MAPPDDPSDEVPDIDPTTAAYEGVELEVQRAEDSGGPLNRWTAVGIVVISILAAVMVWQSSTENEHATITQHHAEQNRLRQQELDASNEASVIQDLRVFDRYEEHIGLARALEADAEKASGDAAAELAVRAQQERALAASQEPHFRTTLPKLRKNGTTRFDAAYARQQARLRNTELLDFTAPEELEAEATEGFDRGLMLTGLAALFVAGIVLLTFAELSRAALSRVFAFSGAAVAALALILFVTS